MSKRGAWVFLAGVVALAPVAIQAAERGQSQLKLGGKTVALDYGRPALAGRDMIAKAEIGGRPWRLGADGSTTLKTEADLDFGGVKVPKGEYVLSARRDTQEKWTLLVKNTGSFSAEVPLALGNVADSVELLTIDLRATKGGGELVVTWATSTLSTAFSGK